MGRIPGRVHTEFAGRKRGDSGPCEDQALPAPRKRAHEKGPDLSIRPL